MLDSELSVAVRDRRRRDHMLWPLVQVSSSSRAAMQQCDRFWGGQGGSDVAGALEEGGSLSCHGQTPES